MGSNRQVDLKGVLLLAIALLHSPTQRLTYVIIIYYLGVVASPVYLSFFCQRDLYRPDERNNQEILSYKIKSIMQTETGKES